MIPLGPDVLKESSEKVRLRGPPAKVRELNASGPPEEKASIGADGLPAATDEVQGNAE
jgi:hypothetical protein